MLDVGCGPGVFLKEFLREFPNRQVTGIDLTDRAVDLARKNLPAAEFSVLDVSKEVPKGEYDLVTMIDVAEHIEEDIACFKNVREACRGHLVIATLEGRMRSFEPELGHVRNYAPGELESKLEEAGYDVIEFLHWGWPMYSPFYRNLSGSVGIHKKTTTLWHRVMAKVAYWGLMFNWPGKGDIVIAVARPKP